MQICGDDEVSTQMDATWEDGEVSKLCQDAGMVAIKFNANSDECKQFSQFYPVICVPCVSFISGETGVPLEGAAGHMSPSDFKQRIQKVLKMAKQGSSTPATQTSSNLSSPPPAALSSTPDLRPSAVARAQPAASPAPATAQAPAQPQLPTSQAAAQEQKKELSKLEKAARLRQKMEEIHQRKEAQNKEEIKNKEVERRKVGQAVQKSAQERVDQETRRVADEIRKEKEEDWLAKERVREQIARDRAEKQSRYDTDRKEREKTQAATKEVAQAAREASKKKVNKSKVQKHWPRKQKTIGIVKCPNCVNEYNNLGSLKRHMRIEHGPKVFSWCRRCEFMCKRRDNMGRHYKTNHAQHLRDLEVIAFETVAQRESRVGLENAARQAATSKPKGSQKRKTGKKTWIAIGRSLCKNLTPLTSQDDVNSNDQESNSVRAIQQMLQNNTEESLSGKQHQEDALVDVKFEPAETSESLVLPVSSSCTTSPNSQDVPNSLASIGLPSDYLVNGLYQCPKCFMTYQQCSSLRRHLQLYHGPQAFYWCRHCEFGSKRKDNLRRHYRQVHSRLVVNVDSISFETREQKEKRERHDQRDGTEAACSHDQASGQGEAGGSHLARGGSSYFQFEIPETWSQMPELKNSLSPDAFKMGTKQPLEMINGLAVTGMPSLQQEPSPSGQEMVKKTRATISKVSPMDCGRNPGYEQPSSSHQIIDSYEGSDGFLMTCSSEPVCGSGDVQGSMDWQAPVDFEVVGCEEVDMLKCPKCSNEYHQRGSLNHHLRIDHGSPVLFWCRQCNFRTDRKCNFKRHYGRLHGQHMGEMNTISPETREQQQSREKRERKRVETLSSTLVALQQGSDKVIPDFGKKDTCIVRGEEIKMSTTSVVLPQVSDKAMPDVGQEETSLVQRGEAESIASVVGKKDPPSVQSESQESQGESSVPSKGSIFSPRVELVKMVFPSQEPAASHGSPPVDIESSSRPGKLLNTPQKKVTRSVVQATLIPAKRPATQNVVQDSFKSPQRRLTRSVVQYTNNSVHRNVERNVVQNSLKPPQRYTTRSVVHDSPNSPQKHTSQNATNCLDSPQSKLRCDMFSKLSSSDSQQTNAAHTAIEEPYNSQQRNANRSTVRYSLDTTQMYGNQKVAQDSQNSQHRSGNQKLTKDSLDAPQRNPKSKVGHGSLNSQQSNTRGKAARDSQSSLPVNATNTAEDFRCSGNATSDAAPVTSTSEGPSIALTRLEKVLCGNVTRVIEESHTISYRNGMKVKEENVKRTYEVMFQADFGNGTVNPVTK